MNVPDAVEQHGYHIHVSKHQAGNMGAPVIEYRAFCSCHWISERTTREDRMNFLINQHLHSHAS